jgi:serine/threonine-protein kinase
MELAPGARLGAYEILSPLGVGGMGEVYRARDTKLGREVAIKVLPAAFAGDPERMARFQREARLLAVLNHPGIATIHGFEEADSHRALVMELVPGPTLAERISLGPLPFEEAATIALQIAQALEYAHEHGIVHRDLKPANVKLTGDGAVKLLDFGLAKALSDEPAATDASQSPTLSALASRAGLILGTAAYMSPEQAKGKAADRRSDVWSFGVVVYEMLSGSRMFGGETAAETLASVLKSEPEWGALPAGTPTGVRRLLRRCLDKDARRRVQAIGEARIAIEDALGGVREETVPVGSAAPFWPRALPLAAAAALAGAGLMLWGLRRPVPEAPTPVRLSVELGAAASLTTGSSGPAAILSPDGRVLAYTAHRTGQPPPQLHVRRLEQLQATPLSGTDGARDPFFSPDGQWIAFFADGKLKKVSVTGGGAAVTIGDAPEGRGGTWSEDGTILFTPAAMPGVGLSRISAAGGPAEVLTTPDPAAEGDSHRWPQPLLGGKAVLFTAGNVGEFNDASIVVQTLPKGPLKVLQRGGYFGRYLRSGHLVYVHDGTLFAAPFDLGRLELSGPPAPVLEGVMVSPAAGGAQFAFSERGTLVFLPGTTPGVNLPIQWMDKDGRVEPLRAVAGTYNNIRFSPDGTRLAMDVREGTERDVWIYEWGRDTMSRLTFETGEDSSPVWSPDGRRIAFASARADKATPNLYWQRADGTGDAERLTESRNPQSPASWHPSGRFLAFHETDQQTRSDIMVLPMEGDETSGWKPGKPSALLKSGFTEQHPAFSPDGRWLAYSSDESGRQELYVRPFPGPGGRWQVSTGGGSRPNWSRQRQELIFRVAGPLQQVLMVASYAVEGDSFRAEKPRHWSRGLVPAVGPASRPFDLHPDGERIAMVKGAESADEKRDHVVLVLNFFEELRRVAPAGTPR